MRKLLILAVAVTALASAPLIPGAVRPAAKKPTKTAAAKKAVKPADKPAVRRWMSSLTLSQKVAQLVIIPFYGEAPNTRSRQYRQFVHLVRDERVGGLILINHTNHGIKRAEPYALAAFVNRMQRMAKIPLIVGSDFGEAVQLGAAIDRQQRVEVASRGINCQPAAARCAPTEPD